VWAVCALATLAAWWGYPLLLVFATPAAQASRAVRRTAIGVCVTLALALGAGQYGSPIAAVGGFVCVIVLFSIGAHVLGLAEHRSGRYRPLNSFWAVLAMLFFPVGGICVHNRWRAVSSLDAT
jgi:hypothetical protein